MKWSHTHKRTGDRLSGSLLHVVWPECQAPGGPLSEGQWPSPLHCTSVPYCLPCLKEHLFLFREKGLKYQTVMYHLVVAKTEVIKMACIKRLHLRTWLQSLKVTAFHSLSFLASELQYPGEIPSHYISWGLNASSPSKPESIMGVLIHSFYLRLGSISKSYPIGFLSGELIAETFQIDIKK